MLIKQWIQTYTGRKFFPLKPVAADLDIIDIAHALSHICRYTGHAQRFYSVAEHSIHVSKRLPKRLQLAGLLHDASEAYLSDIASPVKRQKTMAGYVNAEAVLTETINKYFGLDLSKEDHESIKRVDSDMINSEVPQVFNKLHPDWKLDSPTCYVYLSFYSPEEAKALFLKRFEELT